MLMRWDPFGELDRLARWAGDSVRRPAVAMDAFRRGDSFVMTFDVPGIDPDSIDLTVQDSVLTLRAERRTTLDEYDELLVHERPVGSYTRQVFLGENLDTERLEADYEQGVLTVIVPVAEAARPRKIEIGSKSKAIDAGSAS